MADQTDHTQQAQAAAPVNNTAQTATEQQTAVVVDDIDITTALMEGRVEDANRLVAARAAKPVAAESPAGAAAEPQTTVEPKEPQNGETAAVVEGEQAGVEPPDPDDAKVSDRIRLGHYSDEEKADINAANILARSRKISFREALAIVSPSPTPTSTTQAAEAPQVAPEVKALQDEVTALEAKLDEFAAGEGLYNKEIADTQKAHARALAKLEVAQDRAERKAEQAQSEAGETARFNAEAQAHEDAAYTAFPAARNKDSALYMVAAQLAKKAEAPNHAHNRELFKPTAPRFFIEEAAKMLNIAPANTTASPSVPPNPAAPKQPAQQQAQRPPAPAPGSKQTAPPPPQLTAAEKAAQSEADTLAIISGQSPAARHTRPTTGVLII